MQFARYKYLATWEAPTFRIKDGAYPVDLISIDNLPNIIAKEASAGISGVIRQSLPDFFVRQDKGLELPGPLRKPYAVMKQHLDYAGEVKDLAWRLSLQTFNRQGIFNIHKARAMVAHWAEERKETKPALDAGEINLFRNYMLAGWKQLRDIRGQSKAKQARLQLGALDRFAEALDIKEIYATAVPQTRKHAVKPERQQRQSSLTQQLAL
jgi:hypothetical protein